MHMIEKNLQNTLAKKIIKVWNKKFQNAYYPEANLSLDEVLCLQKGKQE